jgi:NDP-sugar pyrophosphorylase family protein
MGLKKTRPLRQKAEGSKQAVILAGGLGKRLRPFTQIIPKPLLPLGEKALLEIQIEHLRAGGFKEIFLAINYRSDYIRAYLGDGERYDVRLIYSEEKKPLGTAGPLTLLKDRINGPFLVMNGDILTKANLGRIWRFARARPEAELTIATKVIFTPFRFGNVLARGDYVAGFEEKPLFRLEILAGIYILQPSLLRLIPENSYFGIDALIRTLLENRRKILRYRIREYWLDIGQIDDYREAVESYGRHFQRRDGIKG